MEKTGPADAEGMLTDNEKSMLKSARSETREIYALEGYARLWDCLDVRLGRGNDTTKYFVDEFRAAVYEPVTDTYDSRRLGLMRSTFVFPRIGMPQDFRRALLFSDLKIE